MINEDLFEGIKILTPQEMKEAKQASTIETPASTEASTGATPETIENTETPAVNEGFKLLTPAEMQAGKTTVVPADVRTEAPAANTEAGTETAPVVNQYTAFIKDLEAKGTIELEEGEVIDTAEKLAEVVQRTIDGKNSTYKSKYSATFSGSKKKYLEIEDSFTDENVAMNVADDLAFYDSVNAETLKDEKVAKQVYSKFLKAKGLDDTTIEGMVDDAVLLDKLEEKAADSIEPLKTMTNSYVESQKIAKKTNEDALLKAQDDNAKSIHEMIDTRDSFIPGLNLNKTIREKIKSSMSDIVHVDDKGNKFTDLALKQSKNPQEFAVYINYLNSIGMFNVDAKGNFKPDVSKFAKASKTKVVSELDKILSSEKQTVGSGGNIIPNSETTDNTLKGLESIFGLK